MHEGGKVPMAAKAGRSSGVKLESFGPGLLACLGTVCKAGKHLQVSTLEKHSLGELNLRKGIHMHALQPLCSLHT